MRTRQVAGQCNDVRVQPGLAHTLVEGLVKGIVRLLDEIGLLDIADR